MNKVFVLYVSISHSNGLHILFANQLTKKNAIVVYE